METFGYKTVKARCLHQCYWCGELIEPDENYCRWACADDGSVVDTKVHLECNEAWNQALRRDYFYYSEEVMFADHERGCICEKGRCECE